MTELGQKLLFVNPVVLLVDEISAMERIIVTMPATQYHAFREMTGITADCAFGII